MSASSPTRDRVRRRAPRRALDGRSFAPLWGVAAGAALCACAFVWGTPPEGETPPLEEPELTAADREHWSFVPLARPELPDVSRAEWVRTPVDRFVLQRLEDARSSPAPEADRRTLIRRLTFDLTGLPPRPEHVAAFLRDESPVAYERLVERLLASPAYGERWAQHWLDLARFAETDGFEHDNLRPNAWRYRDWVIEAFNADLPYDEFVRWQVAGDQFAPQRAGAHVATGFLLCGQDMPDINSQDERRHMVLNELTGAIGSVFLGLQLACAQCHDHRSDPISQADFYRLRACFETTELFGERELPLHGARVGEPARGRVVSEASEQDRPAHLFVRGDFRRPGPRVEPGFPRVTDPWQTAAAAGAPAAGARRRALAEWLTRPDHALTARVIANRLWQHHFGRGIVDTPSDFGQSGEPPTHPRLLDWLATELPRRGWSLKELHRVVLLSATYRQASRLPARAPAAMVRAWREAIAEDPDNRLFGRQCRKRLDGEAARDALLEYAGLLSQHRGGPGVMVPLPEEVLATVRKDHWAPETEAERAHCRSIYVFVRRNLRIPFFDLFDRPARDVSCPQRSRSTTAPQALLLECAPLPWTAARHFAGRLLAETGDEPDAFIERAFEHVLARPPREEERLRARAFLLASHAAEPRSAGGYLPEPGADAPPDPDPRPDPGQDPELLPVPLPAALDPVRAAAFTRLALVLFNLNESVYVD